MSTTEPIINLKGLRFAYPKRPEVIKGLDLFVDSQTRLGLVGSNGSGKTTLLSIIMGLLKPQAGTVELLGRLCKKEADFKEVRPLMGFVFQDANDQLFCPTVADDIAFGPLNLGKTRAEAAKIVQEVLAGLGLTGFEDRITYDLSGGEKKLVAVGTALALSPKVLILDEPTTFLDVSAVDRLEAIIAKLDLPMVIVSHDAAFLDRVVTSRLQMIDGQLFPAHSAGKS
ncbi:MAG: energy-coupling factor ABC transporter ATP-binding protein [Deltaproteobacteria bacterium]|jgi:cobalt/nickel transport system ATP-binding protein|nr:energy-coupling factor ABC transporter ATP-binding protein [Deltaproteobacteria bacterium]